MKRLMSKIDRSRAASAAAEPAAAPAEGSAAEPKADGGAGGAGETATTAQQMKDLLSSQPASASAYLMRSRALGALGQWDAAAADCSGALERGSTEEGLAGSQSFRARAYCMRGAALGELGRQDAAAEDFTRAIEADAPVRDRRARTRRPLEARG